MNECTLGTPYHINTKLLLFLCCVMALLGVPILAVGSGPVPFTSRSVDTLSEFLTCAALI